MSAMDPTEVFRQEASELFEVLEGALLDLGQRPDDRELVDSAFRALHTIKGTASFLGFEPIVQLGHRAEDVLSGLRRHELQLTSEVTNALLVARDQLGVMLADLRALGNSLQLTHFWKPLDLDSRGTVILRLNRCRRVW